ncbi:TPA: LysM peptidoglycan-binding domain-containing protein [Streptococcus suis]
MDKKQSFSLRKLSVGLVSGVIGTMLCFGSVVVSAEEQVLSADQSPSLVGNVTNPEENDDMGGRLINEHSVVEINTSNDYGSAEGKIEDVAVSEPVKNLSDSSILDTEQTDNVLNNETKQVDENTDLQSESVNHIEAKIVGNGFNDSQFSQETRIDNEQKRAISKVTNIWSANSISEVKEEIERQKKQGLESYVVQWGDTLSSISMASNHTVNNLAAINNIKNIDLIYTGQLLKGVIPQVNQIENATVELEKERALKKIKGKWSLNTEDVISKEIARQEKLGFNDYIIQWGDTLSIISKVTGKPLNQIVSENRIVDPNLIYTGHILKGILSPVLNLQQTNAINSNSQHEVQQNDLVVNELENQQVDETDPKKSEVLPSNIDIAKENTSPTQEGNLENTGKPNIISEVQPGLVDSTNDKEIVKEISINTELVGSKPEEEKVEEEFKVEEVIRQEEEATKNEEEPAKYIVVSGYAYNSENTLLEETEIKINSVASASIIAKTDVTGYFYAHLKEGEVHTLEAEDFRVEVATKVGNEPEIHNILGKFETGRVWSEDNDEVRLKSNVIFLDDAKFVTEFADENSVTLSNIADVRVGDIVVVPPAKIYEEPRAIQVVSVDTTDGRTKIQYVLPNLFDVINHLDIKNEEFDLANAYFVPADGVTVLKEDVADETGMRTIELGVSAKYSKSIGDKLDLTSNSEFSLKGKVDLKIGGKLKSEAITIPDLSKFELGKLDLPNFDLSKSLELSIEGGVEVSTKTKLEKKVDKLTFGKLIIPTNFPGFSIDIPINAKLEIGGKLTYSFGGSSIITNTVKLNNFVPEFSSNVEFKFDLAKLKAEAEMKIGPELQIKLAVLSLPIMSINGFAGIGASTEIEGATYAHLNMNSNVEERDEAGVKVSKKLSGEIFGFGELEGRFDLIEDGVKKINLSNKEKLLKNLEIKFFDAKLSLLKYELLLDSKGNIVGETEKESGKYEFVGSTSGYDQTDRFQVTKPLSGLKIEQDENSGVKVSVNFDKIRQYEGKGRQIAEYTWDTIWGNKEYGEFYGKTEFFVEVAKTQHIKFNDSKKLDLTPYGSNSEIMELLKDMYIEIPQYDFSSPWDYGLLYHQPEGTLLIGQDLYDLMYGPHRFSLLPDKEGEYEMFIVRKFTSNPGFHGIVIYPIVISFDDITPPNFEIYSLNSSFDKYFVNGTKPGSYQGGEYDRVFEKSYITFTNEKTKQSITELTESRTFFIDRDIFTANARIKVEAEDMYGNKSEPFYIQLDENGNYYSKVEVV